MGRFCRGGCAVLSHLVGVVAEMGRFCRGGCAVLSHLVGVGASRAYAERVTATLTVGSANLGVRELRLVGAGLLGMAAVWPAMPVHPPLTCPLRATTGIPCPLCGMTRAVVAAVHGDVVASVAYNPGGVLVVLLAAALLFLPRLRRVAISGWLVVAVGALLWAWNVTLNPTF